MTNLGVINIFAVLFRCSFADVLRDQSQTWQVDTVPLRVPNPGVVSPESQGILPQNLTEASPFDGENSAESAAKNWIQTFEQKAENVYHSGVEAGWNYFTNVTEETRLKLMKSEIQLGEFEKNMAKEAANFPWKSFTNESLQRELRILSRKGMSVLPNDKFVKYTILQSEIGQIFGNATVCENGRPPPCKLKLDPDIRRIMATSRDFGVLYDLWVAWRNAVGPPMREKYLELVKLGNEGAVLNGFQDLGEMWRAEYEIPNLEEELSSLMDQLMPFYKELHAYVRRKLNQMYPGYLYRDGPLPAHLLGNMWANSWINLYDYSVPFPGKWSHSPTVAMIQQNYTVEQIFREAEQFYKSLGFPALPESFWQNSMLVQPRDRSVVCLPAAVDFKDGKDFRVKMCTGISADDFMQAHHQLGHIYYYQAYSTLPLPFRDGANPAFHDAVGSAITMAVQTQQHLSSVGLVPEVQSDPEADINYLYRTALDRIAFLPFGYLVDKWRWALYANKYNDSNMNQGWWELREKYQGVSPPIPRTEHDFDPGATFHVAQHMPYIRYFISYVIQFQFLKGLCDAAGHKGPLMKCDITGSKQAGDKLRSMMSLGASISWPIAMEKIAGTQTMEIQPLLDYFAPLLDWLRLENRKFGEYIGWDGPGQLYPQIVRTNGSSKSLVNPFMIIFLSMVLRTFMELKTSMLLV